MNNDKCNDFGDFTMEYENESIFFNYDGIYIINPEYCENFNTNENIRSSESAFYCESQKK